MLPITEELLQEVLSCPKISRRADRKRMTSSNRSKRNTVYLSSENGKYDYKLFMRQSEEFMEDFSVGLIWTNPAQYIDVTKTAFFLFGVKGLMMARHHRGQIFTMTIIYIELHLMILEKDDIRSHQGGCQLTNFPRLNKLFFT